MESYSRTLCLKTLQPLPPHPELLPAHTLLIQVGLKLNFTQVPCEPTIPLTFKYILTIDGVRGNYTGDCNYFLNKSAILKLYSCHKNEWLLSIHPLSLSAADSKKRAQNAASMIAASDLFGISYNKNQSMPLPPHPCIVGVTELHHSGTTTDTTGH